MDPDVCGIVITNRLTRLQADKAEYLIKLYDFQGVCMGVERNLSILKEARKLCRLS
jgi:hypothetical protein